TPRRHLLGETCELVKVNLRPTDKGSRTWPPQHETFAFQHGETVTRGHQADTMNLGEFSFRIHRVAGLQFSAFDLSQDRVLNLLVSRLFFFSDSLHARSSPVNRLGPKRGFCLRLETAIEHQIRFVNLAHPFSKRIEGKTPRRFHFSATRQDNSGSCLPLNPVFGSQCVDPHKNIIDETLIFCLNTPLATCYIAVQRRSAI